MLYLADLLTRSNPAFGALAVSAASRSSQMAERMALVPVQVTLRKGFVCSKCIEMRHTVMEKKHLVIAI